MVTSQPVNVAAPPATATQARARVLSLDRTLVRRLELPLLVIGGALLILSILYPYWHITLHAPQYPRGLAVDIFVYKMEPPKNVREVDGLNHYIGMIRLTDAATIERKISRIGIPILAVLAVASFWLHGAWRWLARVPMMIYPIVFVADLFAWLYYAGHSLDPHAPLSTSIHEFTPRLLGKGTIGQFSTQAHFGLGFWMAVAAAILVLVATMIGRRFNHAVR
jgi:hypothetical protein